MENCFRTVPSFAFPHTHTVHGTTDCNDGLRIHILNEILVLGEEEEDAQLLVSRFS